MILSYACVSTGTGKLADAGLTGRIEAGQATKEEVYGLLGFPAVVTYGKDKEETWEYYYVTEYPQAAAFVPLANTLVEGFYQNTRVLKVTFDRKGVVKDLLRGQTSGRGEVYPY